MPILENYSGEIEVRIQKAPFDAPKSSFFDEYFEFSELLYPKHHEAKYTRYMSSESSTFAILITFSSRWTGGFAGSFFRLYDLASSKMLYETYLVRISRTKKNRKSTSRPSKRQL
jgi:hypothetical protein